VIEVMYSLHTGDGETLDETRQSEHVPRVGDLVTFDVNSGRSYQVVDVLWHLHEGRRHYVTVTACDANWHKHIQMVTTDWRAKHEQP